MPKRRSSSSRPPFDDWGEFFPPSRPIPTTKGIKAKNERGAFGSSWWARRWIQVLEDLGMGSRLQRGRTYARSGQVLNLDLGVGQVKARVQGSRPTPYKVTIQITPLTDAQWTRVTDALAQQAIFAAQLLAGEMPTDIEAAFQTAGVPLFPDRIHDIVTDCSCPDYANPCKHIAAVYYLLGERFDEDPFLIFHLRGRPRDAIIDALRARRAAAASTAKAAPPRAHSGPTLADQLADFYTAGDGLAQITLEITAPAIDAALLRQLGPAPLGVDDDLRRVYAAMTRHALRKVFGEDPNAR